VGLTLVTAVFKEFWTGSNRPSGRTDESLDSFLSRRFGANVARTFASAFVHGIYAADSRKLSIRAAFPSLWDAETRGRGSVIWGFMKSSPAPEDEVYDLDSELQSLMKGVSVYSFKRGLSTLTRALEKELRACSNVDIRVGDGAVSVDLGEPFTVDPSYLLKNV
jgi:protoporphyrinogen/coproporphyrinogen III oxidase